MPRWMLIVLSGLVGCGAEGVKTSATPAEAMRDSTATAEYPAPQAGQLPAGVTQVIAPRSLPQILIEFESIDCACHLKDVEGRLLSLPGVVQVKWNTTEKTALLVLDGSDVPTNPQIIDMAEMPGVTVFNIKRS